MKPRYIYLVRHGESVGNVNKDIYSDIADSKVLLTPKGVKQAHRAGVVLSKDLKEEECSDNKIWLYSSPYYRTRQTANGIVEEMMKYGYDFRYQEDPRIREQEWGNFKELDASLKIEKERYEFGTFFYRMPKSGESGADVYDRISTFLESIHRDFDKEYFPKTCIIVSHGLTIRLFLMRWFHWTVDNFESLRNPRNCEIFKMVLQDNNKYKLVTEFRRRPNVIEEAQKTGERNWPQIQRLLLGK